MSLMFLEIKLARESGVFLGVCGPQFVVRRGRGGIKEGAWVMRYL